MSTHRRDEREVGVASLSAMCDVTVTHSGGGFKRFFLLQVEIPLACILPFGYAKETSLYGLLSSQFGLLIGSIPYILWPNETGERHVVHQPQDGRAEAKDYFTRHMERSDYYLRDAQEMPGEWHGTGRGTAGLIGNGGQGKLFPPLRKHQPGDRRTAHPPYQRQAPHSLRFHLRCAQVREPRL